MGDAFGKKHRTPDSSGASASNGTSFGHRYDWDFAEDYINLESTQQILARDLILILTLACQVSQCSWNRFGQTQCTSGTVNVHCTEQVWEAGG